LDTRAPDEFHALFATTKGSFVLAIRREHAPLAADRLWVLLNRGFYNGCRLHRVLPGFAVQFGLAADAGLNREWTPRVLPDETRRASNTVGAVGFATSGPSSRSTQLFIHTGHNEWLDHMPHQSLVPMGSVEAGMGVVLALNAAYGDSVNQAALAAGGEAYAARAAPFLDKILLAMPVAPREPARPHAAAAHRLLQRDAGGSLLLPSDLVSRELERRSESERASPAHAGHAKLHAPRFVVPTSRRRGGGHRALPLVEKYDWRRRAPALPPRSFFSWLRPDDHEIHVRAGVGGLRSAPRTPDPPTPPRRSALRFPDVREIATVSP
jgi:cyclophilin family peptidyl-prolyl cis-trans isomerase